MRNPQRLRLHQIDKPNLGMVTMVTISVRAGLR
jgi:hypothetical protein